MRDTMRRVVTWAAALLIFGAASYAIADLAVETDEERIDRMIDDVASARHKGDTLLRAVDLSRAPLEVSVGRDVEQFAAGDDDVLVGRVAAVDDRLGSAPLEVRQRQITIEGEQARVIVNLSRDGELIPCDLTLHRSGQRWIISRLRVMG